MIPYRFTLGLPPDKKLFVLLVGLLGVPIGKAYQIAFETKASISSATAMASKMLKERHIQSCLWLLRSQYNQGRFEFNEKLIDE